MAAVNRSEVQPRSLLDALGAESSTRRIKAMFLMAGLLSLLLSVTLWFSGYREEGLFVGLWVPAVHSLGTLVLTRD